MGGLWGHNLQSKSSKCLVLIIQKQLVNFVILDGIPRVSPLDRLHAVAQSQAAQVERHASSHYPGTTSSDKPVALTAHHHGNDGKPDDLLHSPSTSMADFTGIV